MTAPIPSAGSLRERKKLATRDELANAAYEVIKTHGIDALSADAVAQRAGVSRRTFFNYFPTVEAVVTPIVEEFLNDIGQRLAEANLSDDQLTGSLMSSLAATVRATTDLWIIERFTVIGLAAARSTCHQGQLQTGAQAWVDSFTSLLSARLGDQADRGADDVYVFGAAYSLVAAADAAVRVWERRTGGEVTPDTVLLSRELLAQTIEQIGRGFDRQPTNLGS